MYSSILSNIALTGSKTQFYFPFFCHSLKLLYLAWFVFPHSRGGGTYFCADPVSDDVSISVPLPPFAFLCECMISYEPIGGCLGISLGQFEEFFFLYFDDLDLIFKSTSYHKLSNLSPKVSVCMIFL